MVLPGSMNIAPPPEMRRTTVMPCRSAASASTSLRSDWKLPITTAGAPHSQILRVGLRVPAPTASAIAWSSAMCIAGDCGPSCTISNVWSCQRVACPRARRTAIATASALKPTITTSSASAAPTTRASSATPASAGRPTRAASIVSSAVSGSRKKSPLTATLASRPSATSTSTATSLPPGTLYSPRTESSYELSPDSLGETSPASPR